MSSGTSSTSHKKIPLKNLNERQREAVLHTTGPLLILAGAGSGKTSTMAYRIAHLVAERNVGGHEILGLSFTNKAAGELKERVKKLVISAAGKRATQSLTITTFHSLCARLLRAHAEALGFQSSFSIIDQNDQKDILKQIFKNVKIDDRKFDLDVILFEIGQAKNRFFSPEQSEAYFLDSGRLSQDYGIAAATVYGHYQRQLRILNSMDFDDLQYYGVKLLQDHEEIRNHYNGRFRFILVDEYQDTNAAQFKLLRLLTQKQQNLCVVGDDDQSIYAWRGADPSHILGFQKQFPDARVITLDQNYRSTATILDAANAVISNNSKRHPKKLWSDRGTGDLISEFILEEDREEADFVGDEIQERAQKETRPWKDFAILYRSNTQSRVFEEALRRRKIPYKMIGGLSFLDRKEVKDVLCLWRLVSNTRDDASLRRALSWCGAGIGRTSLETLSTHAFAQSTALFDAMRQAQTLGLSPKSAAACAQFSQLVLSLNTRLENTEPTAEGMVQWAKLTLELSRARKLIDEECEEDPALAQRKWENVEELLHSIGQLKVDELELEPGAAPSATNILREFLNRMTLQAKEDEEDQKDAEKDQDKKNQVTLLTLHGAKGLEYPVVFLVGMEDGFLPHRRTIEEATDFSEERRLCYVGITRARDHLILTRAKNRIRYGKPVPRIRSRFLDEIPKDLVCLKDESKSGPELTTQKARDDHENRVKGFLDGIRANLTTKNR